MMVQLDYGKLKNEMDTTDFQQEIEIQKLTKFVLLDHIAPVEPIAITRDTHLHLDNYGEIIEFRPKFSRFRFRHRQGTQYVFDSVVSKI